MMVNADRHGRRHDTIDWPSGLENGELPHRDEGMRGVDRRYGKPAHLRDPYRGTADRSCKLCLLEFVCSSVGVHIPSVGSLAGRMLPNLPRRETHWDLMAHLTDVQSV
jgi:hypothetical protein